MRRPFTSFLPASREIHGLAGLGVLAGSRHHFVQLAARLGIRLHLPVPIVVRPGMKQRLQLATLLRREFLNRPFDLSNRAHGTKLNVMHYAVNSANPVVANPLEPIGHPRFHAAGCLARLSLNNQRSTLNHSYAPPARQHKPRNPRAHPISKTAARSSEARLNERRLPPGGAVARKGGAAVRRSAPARCHWSIPPISQAYQPHAVRHSLPRCLSRRTAHQQCQQSLLFFWLLIFYRLPSLFVGQYAAHNPVRHTAPNLATNRHNG